jgi:transcriptional regulator with XRE-family HTH domain
VYSCIYHNTLIGECQYHTTIIFTYFLGGANLLGKRLRELRVEKRLTLQQLADELDITKTSLVKYERGEREPNIATLIKIANYFDCSIDWLLERVDLKVKFKDMLTHMKDTNYYESLKEYEKELEEVTDNIDHLIHSFRDVVMNTPVKDPEK